MAKRHLIPPRLKQALKVFRTRIKEEETFEQAAALAYHTLFSLLPTVVLVLLVLSIVSGSSGESNSMAHSVQEFLVRQLALDQVHMTGANGDNIDFVKLLSERIDSARHIVQSPATGLIAFGTLVWGALSLMIVIERAFNQIFNVTQQRPWMRRITLYWSVLTLGPLAVAASLWLSARVSTAASGYGGAKILLDIVKFFSAFAWSWILVLMAYKIIPQYRVKWSSALVGSLVGAILWELGKNFFSVYVRHFTGFGKWYGNIGLVPLFMFWIYYTWLFILVGLQVTFIHQNYRLLTRSMAYREKSSASFADVRWILPLAVLLYRNFEKGESLRATEAADLLNLPPQVGEEMLRSLHQAKIVHRVDDSRGDAYTLARKPETITVEELLIAARAMCSVPADLQQSTHDSDPYMRPALSKYQNALAHWSTKTTLPELADDKN